MAKSDAKPITVEGALVVYSAAEKQYCAGLLNGFSERHPRVQVDFQFGISVALNERYLAELAANAPRADVVWSSAMDLQMRLVLAGGAMRYRSPEAHAYPDGAVYRDMAYLTTLEPLLTLMNRDRFDVRTPAGSLAELAAAVRSDLGRFRGRVACYDIERNGLGFLALLDESRRSADFDTFLDALAACQPKVFGSNPALVDEVASGRAAFAYHVLASYALRAVKAHPSLAIAVSNAAPLAISRVAFIPQRAPHPDAAQAFVDYLLSRDGQQQLLAAGLFPIRHDVRLETGFGAHELAPIRIDQGFEQLLDERRRRKLLRQWQAAVAGAAAKPEISTTGGCP